MDLHSAAGVNALEWEPAVSIVVELQREFPMAKLSVTASLVTIAIMIVPVTLCRFLAWAGYDVSFGFSVFRYSSRRSKLSVQKCS